MIATEVATLIDPTKTLEAGEIREGAVVADLGCGATGYYVIPASKLVGKSGVVYAVDIQKSALDPLRGRLESLAAENVKLVWGDIERVGGTRIPAGTVGLALLVNNLFLAKDRAALVKEALRILAPRGKLVVVDWKPTDAPLGPAPAERVTKTEAARVFEGAGFRLLGEFQPGEYHYGFIFEKP